MKIIAYDKKYDDNIIALMARSKHALGKVKPSINDDILDIQANYIDKGDKFFLGIEDNTLIAMIGYNILSDNTAVLHRFYIRPDLKRHGYGSQMLEFIENDLICRGIKTVLVHLGEYEYYFESYNFYAKHGYIFYEDRRMKKELY